MPHCNTHEICHQKDYEKKNKWNKPKQKFHGKAQYLKLKAPSNNVKMQSDKTLTTQAYFSLTLHPMEIFLNETR